MRKNSSDIIMIKKKVKYFKIILGIFIIILLTTVSGIIFSRNAVKSILKENYINDYNIEEVLSKGITKISHSIVTIGDSKEKLVVNVKGEGNVTGVVIDKQGYIITSFSKIKGMKNIWVKFPSLAKEPVNSLLIGADEEADVAVIKVDSDDLVPVVMSEKNIREGNLAIAVGNSISNDFIGMTTVGVVSCTNVKLYEPISGDEHKLIQTSAVINEDNDGGALCNIEGELIGFNSCILNKNKESNHLYYSLSVDDIKSIVNNIIGLTDRLGISGQLIDDKESGVRGLYIKNITPGGNASKAGLLPTDIILNLDNKNISSLEDINKAIKEKKSGENALCEILRDGIKTKVQISFN